MSERTLYIAQNGKLVPSYIPKRDLKEGQVRVNVHSVGINPVDWKTVDYKLAEGTGQGNDFSGTVVEIGPNVKTVKVGDTVAGGVGGGDFEDIENGAFTDLLSVDEKLLFKFPHNIGPVTSSADLGKPAVPTTFEQAASLGIAIDCAAIAFEDHKPTVVGEDWALIYGFTSSTGFIAAQYARNLGYKVIGVSAELNGVSNALTGIHWVDRKDPEWASRAHQLLGGAKVKHIVDTISTAEEVPALFSLIHPQGTIQFLQARFQVPEDIKSKYPGVYVERIVYFYLMQKHKRLGNEVFFDPRETHKRTAQIVSEINNQLNENKIQTLPITVLHGFDKIAEGLSMSRNGVRGIKIVVNRE